MNHSIIKIAFVRGAYLNNFESQNYMLDPASFQITGFSSKCPIHEKLPFRIIKLWSLADLGKFPIFDSPQLIWLNKVFSNRILGDNQILFGLEKYVARFDIVHTADPHYYYSYQLAKLRQRGKIKKLIITAWETRPFNNESVTAKKTIKYFTLSQADHFICYTQAAKQALQREGIRTSQISVLPLGVDLDRFKPQIKCENKSFTILSVCRLVHEKGVRELYSTFKQIATYYHRRKHIRLVIVGEGPLASELNKSIQTDNLNACVQIRHTPYNRIHVDYQHADLFILLSKPTKTWEEQYGMVLVEAMASGLPIITTKRKITAAVVGPAGLLIDLVEPQTLETAIIRLIEDPDLCQKLAHAARMRAIQRYDRKIVAQKLGTIYRKVLQKK